MAYLVHQLPIELIQCVTRKIGEQGKKSAVV